MWLWIGLGLCLFLSCGGPAEAQQSSFDDFQSLGLLEDRRREPSDLTTGPHTLKPQLNLKLFNLVTPHVFGSAGVGYSDNVLLDDWEAPGVKLRREPFALLQAGTRLDTELGDHRLEIGYSAIVREYWRTGDFDRLEHRARARLDLYGVDVGAHFDGGYQRIVYPQSIQLRGLIRIDVFTLSGWSEARFGRFGVRLGGTIVRGDYLRASFDQLDAWTYRTDFQVYGRILPKLRALLEYNWFVVNYDLGRAGQLNDYMAHQVRAGLDGALTPKLSASLKAGATYQDVDVVSGRDRREFRGFTAEASVGWKPFPLTSLRFAVSRTLEPSLQSNFLLNDTVLGEVSQAFFANKFEVTGFAQYDRADVSQVGFITAHLNRFRTGLRATYTIKPWLSLVCSYEFVRLGSPFPDDDYRAHRVSISIGAGL